MGLFSWLFGGGGEKKDPLAPLMAQLQPLIDTQKNIATKISDTGIGDVGLARDNYDYVSKYLKTLFEGGDDELLKLLDVSGMNKNIDENEQRLAELGVRGSARAASLGQSNFDRDAALSNVLKQLRFAAPTQLAQIAQGIGNLGLGELSAATGAGAQASNTLFGVEQLRDADADRKSALIGSIFEAIGSVAGGVLGCVTKDSIFTGKGDFITGYRLKVGDMLLSYDDEGNKVYRPVIRIKETPNQKVTIVNAGRRIRTTPSHVFLTLKLKAIKCADLFIGSTLDNIETETPCKVKTLEQTTADVMLPKVQDETRCYPIVINGFLSEDDDPLEEEKSNA